MKTLWRRWVLSLVLFSLGWISGLAAEVKPAWELFAFDNAVGRGAWAPDKQAAVLKELGYAGISYNYTTPEDLRKWQETFRAAGLKIYGLYAHTFPDQPKPYDPRLSEVIQMVSGTETVLWITFRETREKKDYDEACVRIARELGDLAEKAKVQIAIYPHAGFYVATARDAARLAEKVKHPKVSASFNLCHEFMTGHGKEVLDTLKAVAGQCRLMSINGVDTASKKYIVPLGQGDFDLSGFLSAVKASGYRGPIGLQGYGVPGDPLDNLKKSIDAWKKAQPL